MKSGNIPQEIIAALEDPKNGWTKKGSADSKSGAAKGGTSQGGASKQAPATAKGAPAGMKTKARRSIDARSLNFNDYLSEISVRKSYPDAEAYITDDNKLFFRDAEPEPEFFNEEELWSRDAEAEAESEALAEPGDYVMDYTLYKRAPEAEPEYFEADFALYPHEEDYDGLELQARDGGYYNSAMLFDIFS